MEKTTHRSCDQEWKSSRMGSSQKEAKLQRYLWLCVAESL